jgi:hypothetical protein
MNKISYKIEIQEYLASLRRRGGILEYKSDEAPLSLFTSFQDNPEKQLRSPGAKRPESTDESTLANGYPSVEVITSRNLRNNLVVSPPGFEPGLFL